MHGRQGEPPGGSPRDRQGQNGNVASRCADQVHNAGDVVGGVGFTIFQIGSDGSYGVVQKG